MTHSKQIAGLVGPLLAAIGIAGPVLLVLGAFLSYKAYGSDAGGA
jgi:hypothetical protein